MAKKEMDKDRLEEISRHVVIFVGLYLQRKNREFCGRFMANEVFAEDIGFLQAFCLDYNNYTYKGEDTEEDIMQEVLAFIAWVENMDNMVAGLHTKKRGAWKKGGINSCMLQGSSGVSLWKSAGCDGIVSNWNDTE